MPEDYVLSKELLRIWWIRNKRKQRIEQMIKDLNNTCLSNGARFEIFHSIFSGQINSFHLGHRIAHLRCLFVCKSLVCFLALRLEYVNFITYKNFNGDFTGSLAFCYPLFNSFKSGSLCHIKEIYYRGRPIYIFMNILMVSFFAWHIEIHNFILVGIIDVKSGLHEKLFNSSQKKLTLI